MKIDGCDQMWCTSCHTPFSWINGTAITTRQVHNPHYFEWLQSRNGGDIVRNPLDIPCGGLMDSYRLKRALYHLAKAESEHIFNIYRICSHIINVERHRFEMHLRGEDRVTWGVRYLLKEVDDDGWKRYLAKNEKDRQKSHEIRDVLDALMVAAIYLFQRVDTNNSIPRTDVLPIVMQLTTEFEELRRFTMTAMCNISKSYNCSILILNTEWVLSHGKASVYLNPTLK